MTPLTLPTNFRLVQLQLTLEALDPIILPRYKGGTLRGGFGHILKGLFCSQSTPCDKVCKLGNSCIYGYIFDTGPSTAVKALSKNKDVPRPFVLVMPDTTRNHIPPGSSLTFGLTLIGEGVDLLEYFVEGFQGLERAGLGRERGQYRLTRVEARSPYTQETEVVYGAGDAQVKAPKLVIRPTTITNYAETLNDTCLTLNFITPTLLKHNKKWIHTNPPFVALISRLRDRVSSLCRFHCGQPLQADFTGLADRARDVRFAYSEIERQGWSRHSSKQNKSVSMNGIVGKVAYEGDLAEFRLLLALGELVHVGKGNVFGNGRYTIIKTPRRVIEHSLPRSTSANGHNRHAGHSVPAGSHTTILNFAQPLTSNHLSQIEHLTQCPVNRTITLNSQINPDHSLADQVIELVDQIGLSAAEWRTLPFVVNLPSSNYVAVALLAEIHGRCDYFPSFLRQRRNIRTGFDVVEIVNLQAIRDKAGRKR